MIKRLIDAIVNSWHFDHISFICEMVGVLFTIGASFTLAVTAKDPNMILIYPLYQIGTIALFVAYYRRKMVWSIALTAYFIVINSVGFIVAVLK